MEKIIASGLMKKLKLEDKKEIFKDIADEEKASIVLQLADIVNAQNRQINLTAIGGAKTAGQYKVTFTKELNDSKKDFYIIDQSVTGMFERRTHVGL